MEDGAQRTAHDSSDLMALAAQGGGQLERLRALLHEGAAPEVATLKQAVAVTRALRGSASLLGLDPLQSFLGRLLQVLDDVESGEVPWSNRIEAVLRAAEAAETRYLDALEGGEPERGTSDLERVETALAAWRRPAAPPPTPQPPDEMPPSAGIGAEIDATVQQVQRLRLALEAHGRSPAQNPGLATLEHEIARLQAELRTPPRDASPGPETPQEGLRNHCEGALHRLVEGAAQEVLDEARERGLCLALRATGVFDPVDEKLGAALLEVLAYLWSDCLEMQAARGEARIDTVFRQADQRLIVEIRDPHATDEAWRPTRNDDDVLGCYPGLRRSRPLVEAVHGLVQVEPRALPGCRFRLTLPLSTERPQVALLRVGRHDVAIPSSAVEAVHEASAVRTAFDAAGAFVEADGMRVPVLHLAFILGDVGFDEMRREHVVVVGSFERRAALFASDARRTTAGRLMPEQQGVWAGTLESDLGVFPMLHVGTLLGRSTPAEIVVRRGAPPEPSAAPRGPATVLVVDSATQERQQLEALLGEAGYAVRTAPTAEVAWRMLATESVDLLLCDLRLPEMNAQQMAERRRQSGQWGRVPMVLVLAQAGEQSHLVVQQLGAVDWVQSPLRIESLVEAVGRHVVHGS